MLGVERSRLPTKLVRREALKSIARSRFRTVKIGDVAGVGPVQVGVNEKDLGVTMAVGKEIYVLVASPEIHERGVLLLARRIAAQKRL